MTLEIAPSDTHGAWILDTSDATDRGLLETLLADPHVETIDRLDLQIAGLRRLRPAPDSDLLAEPARWVYYPWRRALTHTLGPESFRRLRLDRNRNMITADEQARLGTLKVGIVGLSVGHAVAHALAAEGLCGHLRLADFDELELSNLNRVPATVLDLGLNKATVAARRISELDPYIDVSVLTDGLSEDTIDSFLDGLDLVIEECDSLDMKALVRRAARARRLPVLMATSDRGLVDVERFDLDPERAILHGLLSDTDIDGLAGLPARDKVPHVLRIVDAAQVSARGTASMIEVGHTLSTWPQLAGDVIIGAAAIAESVRRIGLGEPLQSGRVRLDIAESLDGLREPAEAPQHRPTAPVEPNPGDFVDIAETVAAAANRAPSGGNSQPWHIDVTRDTVSISLATEHTSTMDVGFRGSAVAVGAAVFNARIAAAAHAVLGPVELVEHPAADVPLRAFVHLGDRTDPELARQYRDMLQRTTNRHHSRPEHLPGPTTDALRSAAAGEGGRLTLLSSPDEIAHAARLIGEADRIRYLTAHLHSEMISELRWPSQESDGAGIDVRSLELDPGDLSTLAILRRPEVMAYLAAWDGGQALSAATRETVEACASLAVVTVRGRTLTDYARGGSATEAVWIAAQAHGVAVHPVSPVFLYAHDAADFDELSPDFTASLRGLQETFHQLAGTHSDESVALVLRLSYAPPPSTLSLRRRHRRDAPGADL